MAAISLGKIDFTLPAPAPSRRAEQDHGLESRAAGECVDKAIPISSDEEDDGDTDDSRSDASFPSLDRILASGELGDRHPASYGDGRPGRVVPTALDDFEVHQPATDEVSKQTVQEKDQSTPQPTRASAACGASPGSPPAPQSANPPMSHGSTPERRHKDSQGGGHKGDDVHTGDSTDAVSAGAIEEDAHNPRRSISRASSQAQGDAQASSPKVVNSTQLLTTERRVSPPSTSRNCNGEECDAGHTNNGSSTASHQYRPHIHARTNAASRRMRRDYDISRDDYDGDYYDEDEDQRDDRPPQDKDARPPRKRRRISTPSHPVSCGHSATDAKQHRPQRHSRVSLRRLSSCSGTSTPRGVPSPPSSCASDEELAPDADIANARYEEWPLQDVSLKRVTQGSKTVFQLQFAWDTATRQTRTFRNAKHAKRCTRKRAFTEGEDQLIRNLKNSRLPWDEIHERFAKKFPERTKAALQVRYCTKLKDK